MPDKVFIDTNIPIYSLSTDDVRGAKARETLLNKFAYWDSLITASALENGCSVLFTEDMQDGQVINNRLRM